MTQTGKLFLSLRFKAALIVALLSIVLSGVIYQLSYKQLTAYQQKEQFIKRQNIETDFDYLSKQAFNQLTLFAEQLAVLRNNSQNSLDFRNLLESSWDDLELLTNLNTLQLYNENSSTPSLNLGQLSNQAFYGLAEKSMQQRTTVHNVYCDKECYLVAAIPIYIANERGSIILVKSLVDLIVSIARLNNVDLAVFERLEQNSTQLKRLHSQSNLIIATNQQITLPILKKLLLQHNINNLSGAENIVEANTSFYRISKLKLTTPLSEKVSIIAMQDVTLDLKSQRSNRAQILLVIIIFVLLFALISSLAAVLPIRKIRLLIEQYSQIAQKRYDSVTAALKSRSKKINDETDVLFSETIELVSKLKKLDNYLEKKNQELEHKAFHDELTQLGNRNRLMAELEHTIQHAKVEKSLWAVVYIDLDNFKQINDNLGHLAGDELLKVVSHRLKDSLNQYDIICRLGGDEFTIILKDLTSRKDVEAIMERIFNLLKQPVNIHGHNLSIKVSAGIMIAEESLTATELLRYADLALYSAKDDGRNCYKIFDEKMSHVAERKFLIENEFETSLANGDFKLALQPQVKATTGELVGVEALVRWHYRGQEWIYPNNFIPILEESERILELGRWVIQSAIAQLATLETMVKGIRMSINLSARQLYDDGLLDFIIALCHQYKVSHRQIELELTETMLVDDLNHAKQWVSQAQSNHFRVAIDDFGTGYSSLSYLSSLPFQVVKLDRSFISHLVHSDSDRELLKAVIQMVSTMDSEIIAEGIEDEEQLNFLRASGCDIVQGFFIQKPVSIETLTPLVKQYQSKTIWPTLVDYYLTAE